MGVAQPNSNDIQIVFKSAALQIKRNICLKTHITSSFRTTGKVMVMTKLIYQYLESKGKFYDISNGYKLLSDAPTLVVYWDAVSFQMFGNTN